MGSAVLLLSSETGKERAPGSSSPERQPTRGSYLVVGDRFLLSQWTASKKAAFQNLSVCLQNRGACHCSPSGEGKLLPPM